MDQEFVYQQFEFQVKKNPEKMAIDYGVGTLSYNELNRHANGLSHLLRHLEVSKEQVVGVLLSEQVLQVIAIMGVFKSSGIYLPLDIGFSSHRMQQVFDQCAPTVLVADENYQYEAENLMLSHGNEGNMLVLIHGQLPELSWSVRAVADGQLKEIPFELTEQPDHNLAPAMSGTDGCYIYFTSGSTGVPKAIFGNHRGIRHFIDWEIAEFKVTNKDHTTQFAAVVFDAFQRDVFVPLCSGATLCIPPKDVKENILHLISWIEEKEISLIHCVPSLFKAITKVLEGEAPDDTRFKRLKNVLMAGEPLFGKDVQRWRDVTSDRIEVVNMWGTSETTMAKTFHRIKELPADPGRVLHVGQPLPDTVVAILNPLNELCAVGEIGELHIRTIYASNGYYRDEARTKAVFVQNPFVSDRVDLIHKTGDLGRYLEDRSIEVLGRTDHQVKVNGVRVELGEIERQVSGIAGIEEVVALTHHKEEIGNELCCYYTGEELDVTHLKELLGEKLNANIIPSYFVYMEEFPLTINGKVDRKALPLPEAAEDIPYEAPVNDLEKALEEIWGEVLGRERVSRSVSFFVAGGNSLKAIQLSSRIFQKLGTDLKLSQVLSNNTIAGQAKLIVQLGTTEYKGIQKAPVADDYPLSHGQKRLWLLNQFKENKVAYNIFDHFLLEGALDIDALEKAFLSLITAHESLRTVFRLKDGEPRQVILPADETGFSFHQIDQENQPIDDLIYEQTQIPFDLGTGPLLRVALIRQTDQEHVLFFSIHHIITDGWSMEVLFDEVIRNYNAHRDGSFVAVDRNLQYKDYSNWQHQQVQDGTFDAHQIYWLEQFSGELPVLDLPTDYIRPGIKSFNGQEVIKDFSPETVENLQQLAAANKVSLFMLVMASVKALLYKYTGQEDIVVGTTVAGRNHADLEDQIGFFVNTLAIRDHLEPGLSLQQLLSQVGQTLLGAYDHQDYPFDILVDELGLKRDMSRSPIFDVLVEMHNFPGHETGEFPEMAGVQIRPVKPQFTVSKYELCFRFMHEDNRLKLLLEYNTDIFRAETVHRILSHYDRVLEVLLTDATTSLSAMDLISQEEATTLANLSAGESADYGTSTVLHLLEEQFRLHQESVGVSFYANKFTYAEIEGYVNALAHELRVNNGITSGQRVAILMHHGEWMPVAVFGVLKAGAAFVPIDPGAPASRISAILADSKPSMILTDGSLMFELGGYDLPFMAIDIQVPALDKQEQLPVISEPGHLAYILYTSGTSGLPKGVAVSHASLFNYVRWSNDYYFADGSGHRFGWFTSFAFDLSLTGMMGTLCRGDELRIYNSDHPDQALQEIFGDSEITATKITPSHLVLISDLSSQSDLGCIILGGEQLHQHHVEIARRLSPHAQIYNEYGPTEATIGCTVQKVSTDDEITIGKPIANTQIQILDEQQQLQSLGLIGEIAIAGDCLSLGYWENSSETSKRFMTDGQGCRMYLTGDKGRWLKNGELQYLGRLDDQLKVNGFRIEPEEITRVLLQREDVTGALVLAEKREDQSAGLICYVTGEAEVEEVRQALLSELPAYMVPGKIIPLQTFPVTINGKVDLANLPKVPEEGLPNAYVPPRDKLEELVVDIFSQVLPIDSVGINQDFFQVGGDSIRAMQIAAKMHAAGYALEVKDIFQYPKISDLSRHIKPLARIASQDVVYGQVSLAPIQKAFFLRRLQYPEHFNQVVLLKPQERITFDRLKKAVKILQDHHDTLRITFPQFPFGDLQFNRNTEYPVSVIERTVDTAEELEAIATKMQVSIDMRVGPVMKVGLFHLPDGDRVFIMVHHLLIDGVSWRVLLNHLNLLFAEQEPGASQLPYKTDSFRRWTDRLSEHAAGDNIKAEIGHWRKIKMAQPSPYPLPPKQLEVEQLRNTNNKGFKLSKAQTKLLLTKVHYAYKTQINDLLLAALTEAAASQDHQPEQLLIMLEGHGRDSLWQDMDVSQTLGWFTTHYPVMLPAVGINHAGDRIKHVKEKLRNVPNNGLEYGILSFLSEPEISEHVKVEAEFIFNYLGQFDDAKGQQFFEVAHESTGPLQSAEDGRWYHLEMIGAVYGEQLEMKLFYDEEQFEASDVVQFMEDYHNALLTMIDHCTAQEEQEVTPSDFSYGKLSIAELDQIFTED